MTFGLCYYLDALGSSIAIQKLPGFLLVFVIIRVRHGLMVHCLGSVPGDVVLVLSGPAGRGDIRIHFA